MCTDREGDISKWHSLYMESKIKWYKWIYKRETDFGNELMVTGGMMGGKDT